MKNEWLMLVLVSLVLLIWAQPTEGQPKMEDVIYFRNGEILRGEVIQRDETQESLLIKTIGRNVILVMLDEVESIKREKMSSPQYYTTSGYMNRTGIEILPGDDTTTLRFHVINGYQFSSRFSVGIGLGFTRYNDPLNLIPFFLDATYKFLEANASPYVSLGLGYNFSVLGDESLELEGHDGGFLVNPKFGIHFATRHNFGWYLQAGYNVDHASFEQEQWGNRIIETDITYKRLQFGVGLSF